MAVLLAAADGFDDLAEFVKPVGLILGHMRTLLCLNQPSNEACQSPFAEIE